MKHKWSIDELQEVWKLATRLHNGQKYGGQNEGEQIEYINHIGSVTFEILAAIDQEENMNANLAIKCAILHDTIEDTEQSYESIKHQFGQQVADGVLALTKDDEISESEEKMQDSLNRIKKQPKEIWAVKMADRISNLYAPPHYWTNEKKMQYMEEAKIILRELKTGNEYLANRLKSKIDNYIIYINTENK